MKTLIEFMKEHKMTDDLELLFEGRKSVGAIKGLALYIKKRVRY